MLETVKCSCKLTTVVVNVSLLVRTVYVLYSNKRYSC